MTTYIHSDDKRIEGFIRDTLRGGSDPETVAKALLAWFDENVGYSRLNAPFFPLQRSDLDVLSMRSGTCGDYSNLIVSVLLKLGYEAMYAYVHRDCYGDEQDHICAAVRRCGEWVLLDAAQPYRKWHGFPCPHREYELLSPEAFEERMKKEESYWTGRAAQYGNEAYAGLLYAPWIHERIVRQTDDVLESVFYLLALRGKGDAALYAYDMVYTRESGSIPMMAVLSEGKRKYRFSCRRPEQIWDDGQWGGEYPEETVPAALRTEAFHAFRSYVTEDIGRIGRSLAGVLELPGAAPAGVPGSSAGRGRERA